MFILFHFLYWKNSIRKHNSVSIQGFCLYESDYRGFPSITDPIKLLGKIVGGQSSERCSHISWYPSVVLGKEKTKENIRDEY